MPYNPVDRNTIGVKLEDQRLLAVFLVQEKGALEIKRFFDIPLQENSEPDVKLLYIDPEEKELLELANQYLTVSCVKGSQVLVRRIRLKLINDKDVNEAFLFQAEPLLPYPPDTAVLDKITLEKGDGSTSLAIFGVKKESIERHLALLHSYKIDPEVVSAEPLALATLIKACTDQEPLQCALEVGEKTTLITLLKEGKLFASHTIDLGWHSLYEGLLQDKDPSSLEELFDIDLNIAHMSFPHLHAALEKLEQSILWNFLAIMKETKIKESPSLYILGDGANLNHLSEYLANSLELCLGNLKNPFRGCSQEMLNRYCIPIGLALSTQSAKTPSINFRRGELAYATPWKRYKKPLLLYGASCLLLCFSIYFFALSFEKSFEDKLKTQFLTLLSLSQKPYDQFEKQYEIKYPFVNKGNSPLPISMLTSSELSERLDFLEKEIRSMPNSYPLLPNTPKVSDVLAWISTHPVINCTNDSKDVNDCGSFSIDSFSYTMVKRPEMNKKNEKYQVKVDLEFNTASPRIAREFHDALITPNGFVDQKAEIKWNATKGKYKTSFYLIDKTIYP